MQEVGGALVGIGRGLMGRAPSTAGVGLCWCQFCLGT